MRPVCDRFSLLILAVFVLTPVAAFAQSQTLTAHWNANPPAEQITSYEVCLGTSSRSCNVSQTTVPSSQLSHTFTPSPGVLYYFAVRAVSAAGKSNYSTEARVSIPNFPQPPAQRSTINAILSAFNLAVSDPDGGTLQFSHAGLPLGLTLNPITGQITGTPTATGTYNVTISVFDGLVTVFRSFVWTIGDVTPPIIRVTSHGLQQTVASASVTVSGTATDFGAGGSGVASITVNGLPATSGAAATGNAIANWSRTLTLAPGVNTINVRATDGAGNANTVQVALTLGSGSAAGVAMTGASLAANKVSPQAVGTQITFSASGTGGKMAYEYQWYVQHNGGVWQLLRSWNTQTTYVWTPSQSGTYSVALWARSAGATANAWQAYAERVFEIGASSPPAASGPLSLRGLTSNLPSPQVAGSTITFTATATGGIAPLQYKWWQYDGTSWTAVSTWSTSATFRWTPAQPSADYRIGVWLRNATTTADVMEASVSVPFQIVAPASAAQPAPALPLAITVLRSNVPAPQATGASITFTTVVSGGTAPHQYKWWVYDGASWTMVRSWSTNNTYTWRPTQANPNYRVGVWVRNATTTADVMETSASVPYPIGPPGQ